MGGFDMESVRIAQDFLYPPNEHNGAVWTSEQRKEIMKLATDIYKRKKKSCMQKN